MFRNGSVASSFVEKLSSLVKRTTRAPSVAAMPRAPSSGSSSKFGSTQHKSTPLLSATPASSQNTPNFSRPAAVTGPSGVTHRALSPRGPTPAIKRERSLYIVEVNSTYDGSSDAELSINVGDSVVVMKMEGEWWYGYKVNAIDVCGWFPSEYVNP